MCARWSMWYHWQDRVQERDAEWADQHLRDSVAQHLDMNSSHALIGRLLATESIDQLLTLIKSGAASGNVLLQGVVAGVATERTALASAIGIASKGNLLASIPGMGVLNRLMGEGYNGDRGGDVTVTQVDARSITVNQPLTVEQLRELPAQLASWRQQTGLPAAGSYKDALNWRGGGPAQPPASDVHEAQGATRSEGGRLTPSRETTRAPRI